MKIKETIERECCESRDMKPYGATGSDAAQAYREKYMMKFCVHCGQLWANTRLLGDMESGWHEVYIEELGFRS